MKSGFSLVESIFASLLLLVAMLLVFQVFHFGTRYFQWVEQKTQALALAEKRLTEIRLWARSHNGWTGFPNGPDPTMPEYTIQVTLSPTTLASMSKELDSAFPEKRELTQTAKLVQVKVDWPRGSVELNSLVVDRGNRGWNSSSPITISGSIPPTLNGGNPGVTLTATATDASGATLDDVFFRWYILPEGATPAYATIKPSRDGRTAVLTNSARDGSGTVSASTGQCRVYAQAVYNGQEATGQTGLVNLAP